jgi:hypothetical protein
VDDGNNQLRCACAGKDDKAVSASKATVQNDLVLTKNIAITPSLDDVNERESTSDN